MIVCIPAGMPGRFGAAIPSGIDNPRAWITGGALRDHRLMAVIPAGIEIVICLRVKPYQPFVERCG